MLNINKVMFTGRLTRDPETRYLPSGMAVTNIGIAVNRRYQDKNGEWHGETSFFDVETFGKLAERCAESLKKGRPIYVEGRLRIDTWERDGVKHTRVKITAERVTGFDVPAGRGAEGGEGGETTDFGADAGMSANPGSSGDTPRQENRVKPTGAPSDHLDFNDTPSVKDDIPF
ncbi:MAG: single-stranded DNA-binding protein [Candidatus Sumerlaeota bacterium]|nr:single-stranded DNA-binding protein [Candidatus Sumerlaeota bacterium]